MPSLAGPKRPQDRVSLTDAKQSFRTALLDYVEAGHEEPQDGYDAAAAESFPASDVPSYSGHGDDDAPPPRDDVAAPTSATPAGRAPGSRSPSPTGASFELDHGAVAIAAITSCTNTSNPSVMIGAALLAKNAVDRGLTSKPWVKTSLAPGSKVVTDYFDRSGLTPYLEKLGFNLVGYGCTTCIGNSGPLIPEVSDAVNSADLAVVAVLSGNRNFEGRINPDIKMNYLASPPLVVAYALAGSMDVDLYAEPLGQDPAGADVFLKDIWPSTGRGGGDRRQRRSRPRCSPRTTPTSSPETSDGSRSTRRRVTRSPGTPTRPTSASPRTSTACRRSPTTSSTSRACGCSRSSVTR